MVGSGAGLMGVIGTTLSGGVGSLGLGIYVCIIAIVRITGILINVLIDFTLFASINYR